MLTKNNINEALADAVMNRPREFFIGKRRFCLWNPSLGQSFIIQRSLSALNIDRNLIKANPSLEALRLSRQQKEGVCNLLALYTFNKYADFCYSERIAKRVKFLQTNLSEEDLAQLLMIVFTEPRYEEYCHLSGISDDQEKQSKISKIKNEGGHTVALGGKTIFGTLICPACEKLHLTPHQAIWEIPLINLQLMLADSINSIYLSDEEIKKCRITDNKNFINADDPANINKILNQDWS